MTSHSTPWSIPRCHSIPLQLLQELARDVAMKALHVGSLQGTTQVDAQDDVTSRIFHGNFQLEYILEYGIWMEWDMKYNYLPYNGILMEYSLHMGQDPLVMRNSSRTANYVKLHQMHVMSNISIGKWELKHQWNEELHPKRGAILQSATWLSSEIWALVVPESLLYLPAGRPRHRYCTIPGHGFFDRDLSVPFSRMTSLRPSPWLVGGFSQPLWKMMEWTSIGMMT